MRPSLVLPLAAAVALLSACNKGDEGTSIALTTENGSGSMTQDGKVKIDTPVFQGSFKLPKMQLDASNFDMDGVHLYPGSKIRGMDVDAAKGDGRVVVRFDAPAAPTTVRDWMAAEFKKAGKDQVEVTANGLKGKDEDGKGFTIDLAPSGSGASGTIHIG